MNDQHIPQVRHELERWLGARITGELVDGVEFELNGVDGYARHRGGKFRASFFLALDSDPELADTFVDEWSNISGGVVQVASFEEGRTLRFLVERPYSGDERSYLYEPEVVRFLRAQWREHADLPSEVDDREDLSAMPPGLQQQLLDIAAAARAGMRLEQPFRLYWLQPQPRAMPDFGFPVVCDVDERLLWVPASRWELLGEAVTQGQPLAEAVAERHLRVEEPHTARDRAE